jgi:hypothetical protein
MSEIFEDSKQSDGFQIKNQAQTELINNSKLKVIVAEDKFINMEAVKALIDDLKENLSCEYCYNGQKAIDSAFSAIDVSFEL